MKSTISDRQLLFLLELIFSGAEPKLSEAQKLKPQERKQLQRLGLISVVPAGGRAKKIVLEDAAWAIAGRELARTFGKRSAPPFARLLLEKIGAYLAAHDVALADFVRAKRDERDVIRSAYLEHTHGQLRERVRIRDLRAATKELSREDFDRALHALLEDGAVKVFAFDNPREKTSDDERDALVVSGIKRHVVYLEA